MTGTVDELRNEIRETVGRYERVESTAFTKEALAAIHEAVASSLEPGRLPPKSVMRAGIARAIGLQSTKPAAFERPFRKAELETILEFLKTER